MVAPAAPVSAATPLNGRIAFYRWFPGQIYSMAPDGTDRTRLTHSRLDNVDPTWSADGSRIAFVRERRTRGTKLMVMGADGSNQTTILEMRGSIQQPDWFPDGGHILFCVEGGKVGYQLFVAGADGSDRTQIGPAPACDAAVSPDGSAVVFTRLHPGPGTDLWLMDAAGTGRTQLTDDAHSSSPTWSPDGSQIAFVRRIGSSGATDLFVMNADGTNRARLTDTRRVEYAPNWSPDGASIVFERSNYWDPYSSTDVWTMASDGSDVTQLMDTNGVYEAAPDWQPV
jgi:TolB protein